MAKVSERHSQPEAASKCRHHQERTHEHPDRCLETGLRRESILEYMNSGKANLQSRCYRT